MATDFRPGDRVRLLHEPHICGVVVQNCPGHGGCIVRTKDPTDGLEVTGGLGYGELELLPARTTWERLDELDVDSG